ncbi:unnamed protein product [Heterobilharzia americana]|nr:unnamed protein product [Heterobilharzia americana]
MKTIMSEYGIQSAESEKTMDSNNLSEAEDYERFGYNYGWARSRKFLKQLVKDNIDLSLVEYEILRHPKNKRPKSWRQCFLIGLRSNVLQIFMSLLVLLDAGIVISEIVLEIQSLQTYKSNFRTQLEEFRDIVCTLMYSTAPYIELPSQCYSDEYAPHFVKSNVKLRNVSVYNNGMKDRTFLDEESNRVKIFTNESNFTNPSPRIEIQKFHLHTTGHLEKDDELLMDICNFLSHWYKTFGSSIKCILENEAEYRKRSYVHLESADTSKITLTNNLTKTTHSNETFEIIPKKNKTDQYSSHLSSSSPTFVYISDSSEDAPVMESHPHSNGLGSEGFCGDSHMKTRQLGARAMHEASEILHFLSIAITALFFLCVLLKVICLGKEFFRDTNEYFDGAIIVASLASDVLYVRYVSETAAAMVVLLLWRIIRIINALMMHKKQQYEFRIAMQKRSRRVMGRKMEVIRTEKEMQDKHILALENLLKEMGVSSDTIRKCKPLYKKCTKEQTNNALKSIAALTTGFMGGLVGAPSHVQGVLSRYSRSKFSSTQNFTQSTFSQSESLNVLSKYQRESVPRPRALSLNPQEHWSSLQDKQFRSLLLQSESTNRLNKDSSAMKYTNDEDILCDKAEKSSASIFLRHTSDDTLNESLSSNYYTSYTKGHYFLKTLPILFKKALNINKHKTNILEEEGETIEQENDEHIRQKQRENYALHELDQPHRTNNSYPHSQTTSTVQEVLELDETLPVFSLGKSNGLTDSTTEIIYMKDNTVGSDISKGYWASSDMIESINTSLSHTTNNHQISSSVNKQSLKPNNKTKNSINNVYNELPTSRKESDEQIWILQPGYIWCQSENQAKLTIRNEKHSTLKSPPNTKPPVMKIKRILSSNKSLKSSIKTMSSKNKQANS